MYFAKWYCIEESEVHIDRHTAMENSMPEQRFWIIINSLPYLFTIFMLTATSIILPHKGNGIEKRV